MDASNLAEAATSIFNLLQYRPSYATNIHFTKLSKGQQDIAVLKIITKGVPFFGGIS